MEDNGQMIYNFVTHTGCGLEVLLSTLFQGKPKNCINLVSNDYLNFAQHHKVKAAAIAGIQKFGTEAGASPLIGGILNIIYSWKINCLLFSVGQRSFNGLYNKVQR